MFLSKRSNGIYYLWFNDDVDRRQKISTGCNIKSDALKFLQNFKEIETKRKVHLTLKLLTEFFKEFKEYSKSIHTIKTQQSFESAFNEFIRIVGDVRLDKIGVKEIEGFLAQKKEEASEWTARKYYIQLASAFETAKRWSYISSNPFRNIQKPKTRETQPNYFTKDEIKALFHSITNPQVLSIAQVALYTGMRLGELLNLQWTDVDFISKVIRVRNTDDFTTKTRKNRVLPLSDELFDILISLRETAGSELVFHCNGQKLSPKKTSKAFKANVIRIGLNDKLHFHSLRHTFASWLVQDGVSLYEVQKLLGHSNISVTQVYSHLQPETLHATVNKITVQLN